MTDARQEGGTGRLRVMPERSILITGCSSGIGLASAREMKARGWRVFATASKDEDIKRLREPRSYVTFSTYAAALMRRLLPTRALDAVTASN